MDILSHFKTTIFLSHQPELESQAQEIAASIEAHGHRVLRSGLSRTGDAGQRLTPPDMIERSQAYIFLITPQSIAPGTRTMSELQLAQAKWPVPDDHVLPVAVARTRLSDIPAYLRAVEILQPRGSLGVEIAAQIDRVAGRPNGIILAAMLGGLGTCAGLVTGLMSTQGTEPARPYLYPGLFLGLAIAFGVWRTDRQRILPAAGSVLAVMVGWVSCFALWQVMGAQFAGSGSEEMLMLFFYGAVFGAVTGAALAVPRRSLRRFDAWLLTPIVGGLAWAIANGIGWTFGLPGNTNWWLIWQGLFAAWIGYWLAQPARR